MALAANYLEPEVYECEGTLKAVAEFKAEVDAAVLRDAFKGLGTNEDEIIAVLARRTLEQRLQISKAYRDLFAEELAEALRRELSGDFRKVCEALCFPPAAYDAWYLHSAIAGLGTNQHKLIEVLCTRTNAQIERIKEAYRVVYGRPLEQVVESDTNGYFKEVLVALLQAKRDESRVADREKAAVQARLLFGALEERKNKREEDCFIAILVHESVVQARAVLEIYPKVYDKTLAEVVEKEFSGDRQEALLALVHSIENKPAYFASLIHGDMKGFGRNDDQLIHIIVTRSEVDLKQIKREFFRLYKKPLAKWISDDTAGDYRKALLVLIGTEDE